MRAKDGKFAAKGDETRKVRSVRLTDWAYHELQFQADCKRQSLGDYLEELARGAADHEAANDGVFGQCTTCGSSDVDRQARGWKCNHCGEDYPDELPEEVKQAIALLEGALDLPANKGGGIKVEIRKAIALLGGEV